MAMFWTVILLPSGRLSASIFESVTVRFSRWSSDSSSLLLTVYFCSSGSSYSLWCSLMCTVTLCPLPRSSVSSVPTGLWISLSRLNLSIVFSSILVVFIAVVNILLMWLNSGV